MKINHLRGNAIYFDGEWKYCDNHEPTIDNWQKRSCGHCKRPNREDEHDACLGELPGVINACCGHGYEREAYVQFADQSILRGEKAAEYFNRQE